MIRNIFQPLDALLRGSATQVESLKTGDLAIHKRYLLLINILLGAFTGLCLGWFSLINRNWQGYEQIISSMVKVPAIFLLTFFITLPSLYVFNALFGSKLTLNGVIKLLLAAMAIMNALTASLGPVIVFFALTTESYSFMVIFTVFIFSIGGVFGIYFLMKTLRQMTLLLDEVMLAQPPPVLSVAPEEAANQPDEVAVSSVMTDKDWKRHKRFVHDLYTDSGRRVRTLFGIWMLLFIVVGMQMAWILRPFLGNPSLPFSWFRERKGNVFEAIYKTLLHLLGAGS